MNAMDPYADDELAALYDLDYAGYDDDLAMYENFARRGETPSLELGIGSGRVALHLARQGLSVFGIDSSLRMLARIEARLDETTRPLVRLADADMRDFDLGERFDLVYCAFGTFEHLLTQEDQLAALRCVERHLSDGGAFVAELRSLTAVDWSTDPSPLRLEWTRRDAATGEMVSKFHSVVTSPARQLTMDSLIFDRIADDGVLRRRAFDVTLRVSGRYEFEMVLQRAGLRLAALYGDAELSPFSDASDSMIVVAERA